jgi:hypothetical protein
MPQVDSEMGVDFSFLAVNIASKVGRQVNNRVESFPAFI